MKVGLFTKRKPVNIIEYPNNMRMIGSTFEIQEGDLGIPGTGLYASTSKGIQERQEDAAVIIAHPQNPNFKMMVVADGMGGARNGHLASKTAIERITEWFNKLDSKYYSSPKGLATRYIEIIREINNEIITMTNTRWDHFCWSHCGKR